MIKDPLTREELRELAEAAGGLEVLIAKRSPSYPRYREQMTSEEGILAALTAEPRLIRRPIWRTDDGVSVGFNAEAWTKSE